MKKKNWKTLLSLLVIISLLSAKCSPKSEPSKNDQEGNSAIEAYKVQLDYYGEHDVELGHNSDGTSFPDTVYYTIPKFSFTNQEGKEISHHNYDGKIFVADFFFTTCKSICPMMSSQMCRLQKLIQKEGLQNEVMFLSHSVKPEVDTPEILLNYGNAIGADYSNWNFVTGIAEDIYDQAQQGYMLTAFPSDTADGGVFHTDKFSLIDRQMHIRGFYDGTSSKSVDQLFQDIKVLIKEEEYAATK